MIGGETTMKKVMSLVCATTLLFLTGCSPRKTDSEIIEDYLENKYHEEFIVLNTSKAATVLAR